MQLKGSLGLAEGPRPAPSAGERGPHADITFDNFVTSSVMSRPLIVIPMVQEVKFAPTSSNLQLRLT